MIDIDAEYNALKKLCRNEYFQFSQPVPESIKKKWPKAPDAFSCPHWVFSEDYILAHPDSKLYWHTPGVFDAGIICKAELVDSILRIRTQRDSFAAATSLDKYELQLEPYRNRMIEVNLDADVIYDMHTDGGTGKINVSFFNDPTYILWTVHWFDYIANDEVYHTVRARTKNEAKVIAWSHSCYKNKDIEPDTFKVYQYTPHVLTAHTEKISKTVMDHMLTLCHLADQINEDFDEQ